MEVAHQFGSDLTFSAGGDLLTSVGTLEGRQRVLRRILTLAENYIWQPTYGGGVPEMIGTNVNMKRIEAEIRAQMLQEQAVAQSPPPNVTVAQPAINTVQVVINYTDAQTGDGVLLGVTLTP